MLFRSPVGELDPQGRGGREGHLVRRSRPECHSGSERDCKKVCGGGSHELDPSILDRQNGSTVTWTNTFTGANLNRELGQATPGRQLHSQGQIWTGNIRRADTRARSRPVSRLGIPAVRSSPDSGTSFTENGRLLPEGLLPRGLSATADPKIARSPAKRPPARQTPHLGRNSRRPAHLHPQPPYQGMSGRIRTAVRSGDRNGTPLAHE